MFESSSKFTYIYTDGFRVEENDSPRVSFYKKNKSTFFLEKDVENLKKILKNKKRTEFKIAKGRRLKDDLFLAL